jgi:Tfp pilus assembly protein PilW
METLRLLRFLSWKPSTLGFSRVQKKNQSNFFRNRTITGFTILELTVASVVSLTILSLAMGMINEQRRQLLGDRTRAGVNDNLRIASDLIGFDVKQAGERLESNTELPGIGVISGITEGTDPDTLVLQRQLVTEVLPICQNITQGTTTTNVDVSFASTAIGIVPAPINDSPGGNCIFKNGAAPTTPAESPVLNDNLRAFRNYRCSSDGTTGCAPAPATAATCQQIGGTDRECILAYIDDPVNDRGEFFLYSSESQGSCSYSSYSSQNCLKINRADGKPWVYNYTYDPAVAVSRQPKIYILEERRYSLTSDANTDRTDDYILQMSINRQPAQKIANGFTNFQVSVKLASGYVNSFNPNLNFATDWQNLQAVQFTLTSINPNDQWMKVNSNANFLSLTSQFFPRNVNSQQ